MQDHGGLLIDFLLKDLSLEEIGYITDPRCSQLARCQCGHRLLFHHDNGLSTACAIRSCDCLDFVPTEDEGHPLFASRGGRKCAPQKYGGVRE